MVSQCHVIPIVGNFLLLSSFDHSMILPCFYDLYLIFSVHTVLYLQCPLLFCIVSSPLCWVHGRYQHSWVSVGQMWGALQWILWIPSVSLPVKHVQLDNVSTSTLRHLKFWLNTKSTIGLLWQCESTCKAQLDNRISFLILTNDVPSLASSGVNHGSSLTSHIGGGLCLILSSGPDLLLDNVNGVKTEMVQVCGLRLFHGDLGMFSLQQSSTAKFLQDS